MNGIVEKGFQQRIGDLEHIGQETLKVLVDIALADGKTPAGLYARGVLTNLGVDLEISIAHLEQAMRHLGWPKDKAKTRDAIGVSDNKKGE